MKKLLSLSFTLVFALCATVIYAQPSKQAGVSGEGGGFVPTDPGAVVDLTLTQATPAGNGTPSQEFEAAFSAYDTEAADDFIIPAGGARSIVSVDIIGTSSIGGTAGADVIMNVYDDAGGSPGALVFTETFVGANTAAGAFSLVSATCPPLPPGGYWISVISDNDFGGGGGQWFWSTSTDDLTGNPWMVQNPGNGFGTGCTTWSSGAACGFAGSTGPGLLMTINLSEQIAEEIVPTLGEWSIIILGILFLIVGVVSVTQRRTKESIA